MCAPISLHLSTHSPATTRSACQPVKVGFAPGLHLGLSIRRICVLRPWSSARISQSRNGGLARSILSTSLSSRTCQAWAALLRCQRSPIRTNRQPFVRLRWMRLGASLIGRCVGRVAARVQRWRRRRRLACAARPGVANRCRDRGLRRRVGERAAEALDIRGQRVLGVVVAGIAATAQTDFDVQRNGLSIGTVRFPAGSATATFIAASAVTCEPGDRLTVIAPATPDATLADIAVTLAGALVV